MKIRWLFCFFLVFALTVAVSHDRRIFPLKREYGLASWYETSEKIKMTCASRDYPAGSLLKITNVSNGKWVICEVREKGPNKNLNRLVDLSKAAFSEIADSKHGLIEVKISKMN